MRQVSHWSNGIYHAFYLLSIYYRTGTEKYRVGRSRNCDIVNHLWLEESFQSWQLKSMANERYTCYPDGDILQHVVGTTPLKKKEVKLWDSKQTRPAVASYIPPFLLISPARESETKNSSRITQHHGDSRTRTEAEAEAEENAPPTEQQRGDIGSTPSTPADKSIPRKHRRPATVSSLRAKRPRLDDKEPVPKDPPPPLSPKEDSTPPHNDKENETEPSNEEESSTAAMETSREPSEAATPDPPSASATTLTFVETPTAITTTSCTLTKSEEKVT